MSYLQAADHTDTFLPHAFAADDLHPGTGPRACRQVSLSLSPATTVPLCP